MHGWRSLNLIEHLGELGEQLLRVRLEAKWETKEITCLKMWSNPYSRMRMQEQKTESKPEHGTWITLHHCGNCSHLLRLVSIHV